MPRHFLKETDFSRAEMAAVFETARTVKANRGQNRDSALAGQTWIMLFHKSSTRTRISFETGLFELGAHPMILDQQRLQTGRGESIQDTARIFSGYVHGLICRTYEHEILEQFAEGGSIPVVNALTDFLHPCQIYTDLFTMAEVWAGNGPLMPALKGRKIAFVGDCASNMAHSFILGAAMAEMEIFLAGPAGYEPLSAVDHLLDEAGLEPTYTFTQDPLEAAHKADVLYTDVWVSMGDEDEADKRRHELRPYQVNEKLMEAAQSDALFMHCLPAHVGEEVSEGVYFGEQSIVFPQAANRLPVQQAILLQLVSGDAR